MNDIFNFFSPLSFVKSGTVAYNPLINYDWSTTTTSGLRYLKDVGSTPTYNASMYFGRGAYLNGVDQSITVPINTTIQTALKRVNGIITINETSQTLTNYAISGVGVHKDYYLFTRLLTTAEKESYTNTPELFYAMAQADSTCVLNMPMCETDDYARNMKTYSESSDMFTSFNNFTRGYQESGATYTISADGKSISNVYKRTDFNTNINLIAGNAYKISTDKPTSGTYYFTYFDNVYSSQLNFDVGTLSQSIFIPTAGGVAKIRVWSNTTAFFNNNSIKQLTGAYPITNYTSSVRDNAKNLRYGLQTCKFVRDSLGVVQSASDYLECNGIGYAIIPSHANKVNIKMTVNPTSLSGNLLSGGVTKTLTGLTLNVDNNVVISNVTPTGTITLASGFSGTIKSYKEELV